jgi:hypothetical protein
MKYYEHPIIVWLIVFIVSAFVAIIFYFLGGEAVEVAGVDPFTKYKIKAGGALAIFLIIVGFSAYWLGRLEKERIKSEQERHRIEQERNKMLHITLYLTNGEEKYSQEIKYKCEYQKYDKSSGDLTEFMPIEYRWDNDYLTMDIRDITSNDLVAIRIKEIVDSTQPHVWEINHSYLNTHTIAAKHKIQR